jgi:transposase
MVAAAQSAFRSRKTSFQAHYQRLRARRGAKRAVLAVDHAMLVCADHVILRREPSREWGPDSDARRQPAATARKLTQRLRDLGFEVLITPRPESDAQPDLILAFSG